MNTTPKPKSKSVASLLMVPLLLSSALITSWQVQATPATDTSIKTIDTSAGFNSASLSKVSEEIGRAVVRQLVNAREALALGHRYFKGRTDISGANHDHS